MHRRTFLHSALAAALAPQPQATNQRPPRIVLRSSWQTVNIGDVTRVVPSILAFAKDPAAAKVKARGIL